MEQFLKDFSDFVWGMPLLVLLVGGGLYFLVYSRFTPFVYLFHAIRVVMGKYDNPDDPGQINHYQALSASIAATVGMGNISGVAVAIATGGAGAIFWMWMSAIVGMATKFFTCTLSIMYRENSEKGTLAGPMYVITKGMGKQWKPLAILFSVAGLIGTLPAFQANQLPQTIVDVMGLTGKNDKLIIGIIIATITASVIFGGIKRIGTIAGKLVPVMVVMYFLLVSFILIINYTKIGDTFMMIFRDAFSADSVLGGAVGALIITGVKRAAFSNEAGMGTAPMMHGNAKTKYPVREGLVAMIGPAIDTILICTLTALTILITGVWKSGDDNGITLTLKAFNHSIPYNLGGIALTLCVLVFSFSTLFSYYHYGKTCLNFLSNNKLGKYYVYIYIMTIVYFAVVKLETVINMIDGAFALMAIPTIVSAIYLSPKVMKASKEYFKIIKNES